MILFITWNLSHIIRVFISYINTLLSLQLSIYIRHMSLYFYEKQLRLIQIKLMERFSLITNFVFKWSLYIPLLHRVVHGSLFLKPTLPDSRVHPTRGQLYTFAKICFFVNFAPTPPPIQPVSQWKSFDSIHLENLLWIWRLWNLFWDFESRFWTRFLIQLFDVFKPRWTVITSFCLLNHIKRHELCPF